VSGCRLARSTTSGRPDGDSCARGSETELRSSSVEELHVQEPGLQITGT